MPFNNRKLNRLYGKEVKLCEIGAA